MLEPTSSQPQFLHREPRSEVVHIPGGLRVSRVALSTWAMGSWMCGGTDERERVETIHAALDYGINLIDTAPVYGFGVAEQIVGRALSEIGDRSSVVLATKAGLEWHDGKVYRNGSKARILREVDDSLRRLGTDYIDICQVHWPDPLVPIEETAEAMHALYRQGKIRVIGVSNFSVQEMQRFACVAPVHVLQSPYNLFERGIEHDVLPYCRSMGIVVLGYRALCRGLLSGAMRPGTTFNGDDPRCLDPRFQPSRFEQYLTAVHRLDEIAREHRRRVIHLAARWVLDQGVGVTLWGGRHPEQMQAALGVAGWSLDFPTRTRIDRVLEELIVDPVGPDLMAPPRRAVQPLFK